MPCEIFSSLTGFSDLLVWPTTCYHFFYLNILLVIFGVLAWTTYKIEKGFTQNADLMSSLGVAAIATFILAGIGTLIKNTSNIPMISTDILLYVIAFTVLIMIVWIIKD